MPAKSEVRFAKNPDEVTLVKTLMSGLRIAALETLGNYDKPPDMALVDLMKRLAHTRIAYCEHPKCKEVIDAV